MSWHTGPMTAFDLETTGVDVETARIVTASIVHIDGDDVRTREWLVNPGVDIPEEATAVHGVTTLHAKACGDEPATAAAQILTELDQAWTGGKPVIIYNAAYDLTVLDRELRRHCGVAVSDVVGPVIDPFCIDKALDRYRRGSRTLTATCQHYGVRLEDAHTSSGDAIAAARLAWRLAQVYPAELADLSRVNALQKAWRADWAVGFQDYLRRQGKDEHVDPSWPMRPYVPTPDCIGADA
ncbi:exonuclease domain-containing protein [uncultured Jatrophihabitans sp.]|uniref:exonuclease domain-containing protein n=1 Tax=uncultured Jatrophihabitans sp. TaxID=1610747 RepID=UPI0035CC09F4